MEWTLLVRKGNGGIAPGEGNPGSSAIKAKSSVVYTQRGVFHYQDFIQMKRRIAPNDDSVVLSCSFRGKHTGYESAEDGSFVFFRDFIFTGKLIFVTYSSLLTPCVNSTIYSSIALPTIS